MIDLVDASDLDLVITASRTRQVILSPCICDSLSPISNVDVSRNPCAIMSTECLAFASNVSFEPSLVWDFPRVNTESSPSCSGSGIAGAIVGGGFFLVRQVSCALLFSVSDV